MPAARLVRLATLAACASACGRGDCHTPQDDMDPARFARWMAAEFGAPAGLKEVSVGSGRLAQVDRRFFLQLTFSLPDGRELGSGALVFEYPELEAYARQIRQRNVPWQTKLFAAVAGMREGGERQFVWRSSLHVPAECEPRDGHCRLWLGDQLIAYPPETDITVRAHLDRLCAPSYCVAIEYSIPKSVNYRLVERSCR